MLGHRLTGDSPDPAAPDPREPERFAFAPPDQVMTTHVVTALDSHSDDPTGPVWTQLEDITETQQDDPIFAFAPAPRIDWGPKGRTGFATRDRGLLKRLRPQTR